MLTKRNEEYLRWGKVRIKKNDLPLLRRNHVDTKANIVEVKVIPLSVAGFPNLLTIWLTPRARMFSYSS